MSHETLEAGKVSVHEIDAGVETFFPVKIEAAKDIARAAVAFSHTEVSSVEYPNHSGGALIDAAGNRVLEFISDAEQDSSVEITPPTKVERALANEAIREVANEIEFHSAFFSEGPNGEFVVNDGKTGKELERTVIDASQDDRGDHELDA